MNKKITSILMALILCFAFADSAVAATRNVSTPTDAALRTALVTNALDGDGHGVPFLALPRAAAASRAALPCELSDGTNA